MMPVASCMSFPFSAECNNMLAMLVYATRWLSLHLYMLAYMFMHESYLLVCRPCFNTMKSWTFDPNLHLSLADIPFCLLSCFFVCYLLCLISLFACWLAFLLLSHVVLAISIFLVRFASSCYYLCIFFFHCLFVGFFSMPLHVPHGVSTHRARAQFPKHKQKG